MVREALEKGQKKGGYRTNCLPEQLLEGVLEDETEWRMGKWESVACWDVRK